MSGKRCFFIGHREATQEILPELERTVMMHIEEYGVTEFLVGRYGSFDHLAARVVITAKQRYPSVRLTMLLPYHPSEHSVRIPKGFTDSWYPSEQEFVPHRAAIVRANQYAVDHSDYLIAYVWHAASNARDLLEYAKRRQSRHAIQITMLTRHGDPAFVNNHIFRQN